MWWKLIHDQPDTARDGAHGGAPEGRRHMPEGTDDVVTGPADPEVTGDPAVAVRHGGDGSGDGAGDTELSEDDRELAAYNRYLAELDRRDRGR